MICVETNTCWLTVAGVSTPKKSPGGVNSTAQLALVLGLSRWTVSRVLNATITMDAHLIA